MARKRRNAGLSNEGAGVAVRRGGRKRRRRRAATNDEVDVNRDGSSPSRRTRRRPLLSVLVVLLTCVVASSCAAIIDPRTASPVHSLSPNLSIEEKKKKKKRKKSKATPAMERNKPKPPSAAPVRKTASSSSSSLGGSTTATMRRIQREWKDAIESGIAFDWVHGKPVESRRRRRKNNNDDDDEEPLTIRIRPQHIWLGPASKRAWWQWHFTVTGLAGTVYERGVYHGRLILPRNYPLSPPRVQLLTPSGRFLLEKDICLTASSYHPETWQPAAWSLRTLVESLRLHFAAAANEVGGVSESYETRLRLAEESRSYRAGWFSCGRKTRIDVDHGRMVKLGWIATPTSQTESHAQEKQQAIAATEEPVVVSSAEGDDEQEKTDMNGTVSAAPKKKKKRKKKNALPSSSLSKDCAPSQLHRPRQRRGPVNDVLVAERRSDFLLRCFSKKHALTVLIGSFLLLFLFLNAP